MKPNQSSSRDTFRTPEDTRHEHALTERARRGSRVPFHGAHTARRSTLAHDAGAHTARRSTLAHDAATVGSVRFLTAQTVLGNDIRSEDRYGGTPLHKAAATGQFEAIETLINLGAHSDSRDSEGKTALYTATMKGHVLTIQLLGAGDLVELGGSCEGALNDLWPAGAEEARSEFRWEEHGREQPSACGSLEWGPRGSSVTRFSRR
ncbi:hypothetical protein CYMTET_39063 [Cymbomonas tetramitiformis]|uniref:Uncharacterized protein n=1 Tax=Cymbomonas tetramitiformis TaxID=36881 RepID=A0AAE0CD12_9CHLO|nr:hypothetical protein CYMTET_39063 [Cymbomonas tetramitiformis]